MECVICKNGTTRSGFVTVTLERDNCIVILKQVPADICQNCGEYYQPKDSKKPSGKISPPGQKGKSKELFLIGLFA